MRSTLSSWTKLYTRLGFRRVYRSPRRNKRIRYRGQFESLEPRKVFDVQPILVDTLEDQNDGPTFGTSLRDALQIAASQPGPDVIQFAPSLFANGPGEIRLTYDGPDQFSVPDTLVVGGEITIQGPGADKLKISGNDQTGVFSVFDANPYDANPTRLAISDLTITKGNAQLGGAIHSLASEVSLSTLR